MPWRTITSVNVQGRFTASEQTMLAAASGSSNKLSERLADAVKTFVGTIGAAGWDVSSDGSVPDQLRNTVMSYAVWEWLKDFPQLDKFKTKERMKAYDDAVSDLGKIAGGTFGYIESPLGTDVTTGNWNSKPKIIGRMNPTPLPASQLAAANLYANPNAPDDVVDSNSPDVPVAPIGVAVMESAETVLLYWLPQIGADSYNVYRSTTSGFTIDGVAPLTNTTGTNYADSAVTDGVTYFYCVTTIQGTLESAPSAQVSINP